MDSAQGPEPDAWVPELDHMQSVTIRISPSEVCVILFWSSKCFKWTNKPLGICKFSHRTTNSTCPSASVHCLFLTHNSVSSISHTNIESITLCSLSPLFPVLKLMRFPLLFTNPLELRYIAFALYVFVCVAIWHNQFMWMLRNISLVGFTHHHVSRLSGCSQGYRQRETQPCQSKQGEFRHCLLSHPVSVYTQSKKSSKWTMY